MNHQHAKHLIALSGKMHSGKDTVALIIRYLVWEHNRRQDPLCSTDPPYASDETIARYVAEESDWLHKQLQGSRNAAFETKRFAGPVKEIAAMLTGFKVEVFEDQVFKETTLGPEWDLWGIKRDGGKHSPGAWFGTEQELRDSAWYQKTPWEQPHPEKKKAVVWRDELVVRKSRTVRSLLQDIGTGAMRDVIHPNVWVNALFAHWHTTTSVNSNHPDEKGPGLDVLTAGWPTQHWLITDMRFPNELQAVQARQGLTIRINRPGHDTGSTHPSETALDKASFNEVIVNDGTLEDLVAKVRGLLTVYGLV